MKKFPLALQTVFAQLIDDCMDAAFDSDFDERGSFIKKRIRREDYWYYQKWQDKKPVQAYVGPAKDPEISKRVDGFANRIKPSFTKRRSSVRALVGAGYPRPDHITGALIDSLWKAGFFRLRGVLIGTTAYQCYAGHLGIKLSDQHLRTMDADFAQYLAVSQGIKESMPPMDGILKAVDPSFRGISAPTDNRHTVAYVNNTGYRVEFLTPMRNIRGGERKPILMPAPGGVSAIPRSYLDYLIHEPMRSVILHGAGVPVTIPTAERYAVHKLIVAANRAGTDKTKVAKDIAQAVNIIKASEDSLAIAECWAEAWGRGPKWRVSLKVGRSLMPSDAIDDLKMHLDMAYALNGEPEELRSTKLGFDFPKDL